MIKNGIFNVIGQILKLGSSVLVMPLLVRFLGISIFGLLSWTTAILTAVQLAEGGLGAGLLYFLSDTSSPSLDEKSAKRRNQVLSSGVILLLISALLVLVVIYTLTPILAATLNEISIIQRKEVESSLFIGAFLIGIRIIQSFFWAVLQSRQLYKIYNVVSTLQIIFTNCTWALLAYNGDKYLPNYIFSSIIISLLFTGYLTFLIIKIIPQFRLVICRATTQKMFQYNLGVWGSNVGSILFSQGDKLIVANTLGLEVLSIYTIFTNIVNQLNSFTGQAAHPILPLISSISISANTTFDSVVGAIKKFFLINVYMSLGGAGILIIWARPILIFFLGNNFIESSIIPFQTLALIYGIYTLSVTGYYIMLSIGQSKKVMKISIICSILTLVSMYVIAKDIGLLGIVISNSFFLLILILLFQGMKAVGIQLREWIKLILLPLTLVILLNIFAVIRPFTLISEIILTIIFASLLLASFANRYIDLIKMKNEPLITIFKSLYKQLHFP